MVVADFKNLLKQKMLMERFVSSKETAHVQLNFLGEKKETNNILSRSNISRYKWLVINLWLISTTVRKWLELRKVFDSVHEVLPSNFWHEERCQITSYYQ